MMDQKEHERLSLIKLKAANKNKRMMSRDDLMHLLSDSIDKASNNRGDKQMKKRIKVA